MSGDFSELNRRDRRRLELRERILEDAQALFEEQGYDETKVSEICERADIAYGTFFNHFPEKRDVLRQLADRAVGRIAESLEELVKQPGTIEDQLIALFEGQAESARAQTPQHRDLLSRIHAIAYTEEPEHRDRRYQAAFEAFIAEGVARGRVRSDFPPETLAEIVASSFSSMALHWANFADYPIRERAAASARFLASALAPQRG